MTGYANILSYFSKKIFKLVFKFQITEEDERSRASSRNSMDKDYVEKFKSQIAKEETSSIVESEDGVAKIHIGMVSNKKLIVTIFGQ